MGASYEFQRNIEAAKAAGSDRAARVWQAQQDLIDILKEAGTIEELPLEVRPVAVEQPQEGTFTPEQLALRESFTEEEKEALINDGAVIYLLRGETILSQKEAQKAKGKPSFGYVVDAGDMLLAKKPREIEVAIYPDPEKFFVPNSFNENVDR